MSAACTASVTMDALVYCIVLREHRARNTQEPRASPAYLHSRGADILSESSSGLRSPNTDSELVFYSPLRTSSNTCTRLRRQPLIGLVKARGEELPSVANRCAQYHDAILRRQWIDERTGGVDRDVLVSTERRDVEA